MSFSKLYDRVQAKTPKISTRWLRDEVIALTGIESIKQQWTGVVDGSIIRGWYIEGPQGPPVPLDVNESLIVLARSHIKQWRRMVYTKELMHAFDEPEEKTDSPEKFDRQIERFGDPAAEVSPQYRAESKAFWRALAVLCPEAFRLEQKERFEADEVSLEVIAARLKIPVEYVADLFREDFLKIIKSIK